mmetsp:Transcript_15516/g.25149  ORF Transcript_15516/g.25149 Transcript_15516/m.25149 type:complete len:83 (+) Transcript_15516:323-571(+)
MKSKMRSFDDDPPFHRFRVIFSIEVTPSPHMILPTVTTSRKSVERFIATHSPHEKEVANSSEDERNVVGSQRKGYSSPFTTR